VILFRCFAWDESVSARARGGPLWFPRMLQGEGRHDNPTLYGCLYASVEPVSAVVEQLAGLTGTFLDTADLFRHGRPLALGALELPDEVELADLDDPRVLQREGLRPSRVATNNRSITQTQAAQLFVDEEARAGMRWWSTFESLWLNVTLFDRAEPPLAVADVQKLDVGDDVVREAADFLGLPVST
jgi:RES domain-containing protein